MTSREQSLIQRHFAPISGPGALALRDDAAWLTPPPGQDLVVTTDAIVAGVHFLPDDAPGDIARKALRVNLSDLAAKGAEPLACLLTLCLPEGTDDGWVAGFAKGLGADLEAYRIALLGGDTVRAPLLSVSITALGTLPRGAMVRRDGAGPGDRLFVTGTIGDAALGLLCRRGELAGDPHLLDRYLRPRPRSALAGVLRAHARAAMDVSDGLAGDCDTLLAACGVTARIDVARIPLSEAARRALDGRPSLMRTVLTGGDDYEILCAVPQDRTAAFRAAAATTGIAVTDIGRIEAGDGPAVFSAGAGPPLELGARAFSHL